MRQIGFLLTVTVCTVAYAPIAAADLESEPLQPPTYSLADLPPPDFRLYIPAWADQFGQMPDLGINDDTAPAYPFDIDNGSNARRTDPF